MSFQSQNDLRSVIAATLPDHPSPKTSDRYSFINTKTVVDNMLDLGYQIYDFRRPNFRTPDGRFGLHEVDFRLPEHMKKPSAEAPRILFYNTYDGSRRAQFLSGLFRFACSNGLIIGDKVHSEKYLHMNLDEAEFLEQLGTAVEKAEAGFARLDRFREITLDPSQYRKMAKEAIALRYPEGTPGLDISPDVALMPRRREDVRDDLWINWNILQENLMKGGLPGLDAKGEVRVSRPVNQIARASRLNQDLWGLLETYAEAA